MSAVLVTCGPTREALDPVRFLSNRSTGTLGIELARAFAKAGHRVVLAAGPIELPGDLGPRVRIEHFESARELRRLALREFKKCDVVCMAAAVADFRPASVSASKIKRASAALTVRLVPNPDILADLGRRKRPGQFLVGFAVESSAPEVRGRAKLRSKNLDLIAVQRVGRKDPFGPNPMDTTLIDASGVIGRYAAIPKRRLAAEIVRRFSGHNTKNKYKRS